MKKGRKLISLCLVLAITACAFAGCGGKAAETKAPEGAAAETETTKAAPASKAATAESASKSAPASETAPGPSQAGVTGAGSKAGAASAAAPKEEIPAGDISITWEDSRVYADLSLGRYRRITTYGVKGYEDVPFITVHDYLDILCEGRQRITVEDNVMKVFLNGTEVVIDPWEDTIRFDDPARFRSFGEVDGAIVEESEYNVITASEKHASRQEDTRPLVISLRDYHMPVIAYEDTVLMPFLALQNTFGAVRMCPVLAYNGKDYFNAFEADDFLLEEEHAAAKDSPYIKAIYSGPFAKKDKTTQAYADYGYYSVCLLLDLTFGHKEEKNITSFDEYFTRMNAKPVMTSTDPSSAMLAEFMLFNYLFDSGHDSVFHPDTVFGVDVKADADTAKNIAGEIMKSEAGRELFSEEKAGGKPAQQAQEEAEAAQQAREEAEKQNTGEMILGVLTEKGLKIPEIAPLLVWSTYMEKLRPADYGDERLDYAGDTAVIYFNAFKDDTAKRQPSYYLDPIREEDAKESSFAFFYQCFEDIKKHKDVKKVVINLADNGGGAAAGLISILGFLSEDGEVRITDRDMMTGSFREECYHVDTNLDGIADERDVFGGQYDFYILCSGSSYSCGNALPYFAQQQGLAKIIGTAPGGGDCVVAAFIDAYGHCAYYSGMLKLGNMEGGKFVSNENGTEPDLNMMPSVLDYTSTPWFDPEGIADAVRQYENGATEISYGERDPAEIVTTLLEALLEKLEKAG